jgi:hypothetical protein
MSTWSLVPFDGKSMSNATGPRTPRGKARSSRNAAKHWIASGRILQSEQKEAAFLRQGFADDFKPQGMAENEIVDDLTFNRLIRRRIDAAFTREFSKASLKEMSTWLENYEHTGVEFWLRFGFWKKSDAPKLGARLGPSLCIAELGKLCGQINERGVQPAEDLVALLRIYGGEPTFIAAKLIEALGKQIVEIEGHSPAADPDEFKKYVLEDISREIKWQQLRLDFATKLDAVGPTTDFQKPASPALETLIRYGLANTREFGDLLDSLERVRHLLRRANEVRQTE